MQYRDYGSTGLKVSALGYGAMRLPKREDGSIDEEYAMQCVHRAFELGVNYIDTAHGYHGGESEVFVGKAVKAWGRDKIIVSTKNPSKEDTGDKWREKFDITFERMGLDCIDVLHFHYMSLQDFDDKFKGPGQGLSIMRKLQDEGLIKYVVFSSHDKPENIKTLINTGEFDGMTVQYNLLDRANEEAIALAHDKGMAVMVMGPVGGGRLVAPSQALLSALGREIKSTPEIALRFVLSNPNVSTALSGMNSIEQVEENAATASDETPLTDEERKQVEGMLDKCQELSKLYCTGCNYCMPCPNEVNIPENFRIMNLHKVWGMTDYAKAQYRKLANPNAKPDGKTADACEECGECEEKCPQNIPIQEQLKETAKALGE